MKIEIQIFERIQKRMLVYCCYLSITIWISFLATSFAGARANDVVEIKMIGFTAYKNNAKINFIGESHVVTISADDGFSLKLEEIFNESIALAYEFQARNSEDMKIYDLKDGKLSHIVGKSWAKHWYNRYLAVHQTRNSRILSFDEFDRLQPVFSSGLVADKPISANKSKTNGESFWFTLANEIRSDLIVYNLDTRLQRQNIFSQCMNKLDVNALFALQVLEAGGEDMREISQKLDSYIVYGKRALAIQAMQQLDRFGSFSLIRRCVLKPQNERWLRLMIENPKRFNKLLVVVGFSHLVGEGGFVEILKKNGFKIVWFDGFVEYPD